MDESGTQKYYGNTSNTRLRQDRTGGLANPDSYVAPPRLDPQGRPVIDRSGGGNSGGRTRTAADRARTAQLKAQAENRWGTMPRLDVTSDQQVVNPDGSITNLTGQAAWRYRDQMRNINYTADTMARIGGKGMSSYVDKDGNRIPFQDLYLGMDTDPALNLDPLYDTPGGGGGGGGGYGYGGGVSPEMQANVDAYAAAQLAAIAGIQAEDVGDAPQDLLSQQIRDAIASDALRSEETYGGVEDLTANAYRDMNVPSTPVASEYGAALLAAQNADPSFAALNQAERQGELNADAYLWDQYKAAEAARTDQFNAARNADVMTMAANSKRRIEAQEAALLAQAGAKYQNELRQYDQSAVAAENRAVRERRELGMKLMQDLMSSGADITNINLDSIFGGAL